MFKADLLPFLHKSVSYDCAAIQGGATRWCHGATKTSADLKSNRLYFAIETHQVLAVFSCLCKFRINKIYVLFIYF